MGNSRKFTGRRRKQRPLCGATHNTTLKLVVRHGVRTRDLASGELECSLVSLRAASGTPAASTSRWCLEPVRARSTGEGPVRPLEERGCGLSPRPPRDQSIRPEAFKRRRTSRCSRSHTPARCHSRNRRQAVTPEQPICRGTIRHGTPVTSTNTIAVNAVRSLTRGRPVRRRV
jgi:hypothetical protein